MLLIHAVQQEVIAGRPDLNFTGMVNAIDKLVSEHQDITVNHIFVFPELNLPGYMVGDLWDEQWFIHECEAYNELLLQKYADKKNICIIYGNVIQNKIEYNESGRLELYNSAIICNGGNSKFIAKTNFPNYRQFDDKRWFSSINGQKRNHNIFGTDFYISICEDAWDDFYKDKLINQQSEQCRMIINMSCSPYTEHKNEKRDRVFGEHAKRHDVLYVNCVGQQNIGKTVFTFDGDTTLYHNRELEYSDVLYNTKHCKPFVSGIISFEIPKNTLEPIKPIDSNDLNWLSFPEAFKSTESYNKIFNEGRKRDSIICAIKKYFAQTGCKKVVIGLSGGLDSAVVAALHVEALGANSVIAVNMPSQFNSQTTKNIAKTIADLLGIQYLVIPIEDELQTLKHKVNNELGFNVTSFNYENMQARHRGASVLALVAAQVSGVFTCNANKSEITVGYGTMNGDIAGYLAPIGDLWKTEVYELAEHYASIGMLPRSVIDVKPSAELSSDQSIDAGKGDPLNYQYHDKMFASWIEKWVKDGPEDTLRSIIISEDFATLQQKQDAVEDLERWWKMYKGLAVSKRVQAPPVVAVSRRSFGFDHRESILDFNGYYSLKYKELKKSLFK